MTDRTEPKVLIFTPQSSMMTDPDTRPIARAARQWLAQRKPEATPCIVCDAKIDGEATWAIMVIENITTMISSICPRCSQLPNLETIVLTSMRTVLSGRDTAADH
jgi:hypothetical protein